MTTDHRRSSLPGGKAMGFLATKPRWWIAVGGLVLAFGAGASVLASTAYLSTTNNSSGAGLTAGTVSLTLSGGASATAWVSTTGLGVGAPNATYQVLTVTNAGTGSLRFAMTSTPTGTGTGLTTANEIELDVAIIGAGQTCNATNFGAGVTITPSTAVLGNGTTTAEVAVIGSKTAGQQGTDGGVGDQVLEAGSSDRLCLRTYVLPGAGRGAQAVSAITSSFTFYAEQTANNP